MAKIAIINPAFEVSYWGLEHAQKMMGYRANMPVASLPLLAALTPPEHEVVLIDENVEDIDYDMLADFDIVGITGMSVQRFRMEEILTELRAREMFVVAGGPWVTVEESYFESLVDVTFVGEAEVTWPQFLTEWENGTHSRRYEQAEKTDMTTIPTPRHDLLKNEHYMFGSLQFSRGCPFQCEFCDIIVTFGRRPRIKNASQIIDELNCLKAQGVKIGFIVDDNLIGNKKAIKPVLAEVARWQEENDYPMVFSTEASLDLCEDAELMELMARCNIQSVFIGIESPNEESLKETKKYQNVRERGGSIVEKVHIIQDFGIEVWCGLIVGFDNDTPEIFENQKTFIKQARITHAMIGLLHAIPKTPLYDRLKEEGRLDMSDQHEFGTNVIPKQMSREELLHGYLETMQHSYQPDVYFDRLDSLFLNRDFMFRTFRTEYFRKHKWLQVKQFSFFMAGFCVLFWRLMRGVPDKDLRKIYRRRIFGAMKSRFRSPSIFFFYTIKCAMHYHHYKMTTDMIEDPTKFVSSYGKSMRTDSPNHEHAHEPAGSCSSKTPVTVGALPIVKEVAACESNA
ncbi:B12-binding domain-containing radical SAM protein [Stieleria varia]|uniref:Ribosomal protein S12 methylthiotransferase RimO n=1 Tax=Stieleria varia TaxID=2528005 RepID=A0A5C6AXQ0_9BACT|nr:B12-binding domain-containing radical SAM protein [Stieleria varia]TWU04510.1 Ribosomal protein S12 methylthiotransferase RimO [Stieleria varia]